MKIVFTFFSLFFCLTAFGQQVEFVTNDSLIYWSENYKLKWSDFKGKVNGTSTAASSILWHSSLKRTGGQLDAEVTNVFNRLHSWTTDSTSSQLLEHEQLHFDITEVFCRKIRKGIAELIESGNTSSEKIQILLNKLSNEKDCRQNLYDKETAHGTNGLKQLEWRKKIDFELDKLKSYAYTTIIKE